MTRYQAPGCPQDAAHGPLLDWPTATAAFYCPNVRHTAGAFYTTDLAPAPRGPLDFAPASPLSGSQRPAPREASAPSATGLTAGSVPTAPAPAFDLESGPADAGAHLDSFGF